MYSEGFTGKSEENEGELAEIKQKLEEHVAEKEKTNKEDNAITTKNKELLDINTGLIRELKYIKQQLDNLRTPQNFTHIEKPKENTNITKDVVEKLERENDLLRRALKAEQNNKVARSNEIVVLKENLREIEKKMKKCEDTRYNLSVDIQILQSNIQRLTLNFNKSKQYYQSFINLFNKVTQ